MNTTPNCPKCSSSYVYADESQWTCPECGHGWSQQEAVVPDEKTDDRILDANGNILQNGDTVVVIKSLPIKGSPQDLKIGTKVKNIRLVESSNGHNIACKIDGIGALNLKSEFVRKA